MAYLSALPCKPHAPVLLTCPEGLYRCTAKQCWFVTLTHSANYCGFFLCLWLMAQVPGKFTVNGLDGCFLNRALGATGVSLGPSGGLGGGGAAE